MLWPGGGWAEGIKLVVCPGPAPYQRLPLSPLVACCAVPRPLAAAFARRSEVYWPQPYAHGAALWRRPTAPALVTGRAYHVPAPHALFTKAVHALMDCRLHGGVCWRMADPVPQPRSATGLVWRLREGSHTIASSAVVKGFSRSCRGHPY